MDFSKIFKDLLAMTPKDRENVIRAVHAYFEGVADGSIATPSQENLEAVIADVLKGRTDYTFNEPEPKGKYINLDLNFGNTRLKVRI